MDQPDGATLRRARATADARRTSWICPAARRAPGHGFTGHGFTGHGFTGHGFTGHGFTGPGIARHWWVGHWRVEHAANRAGRAASGADDPIAGRDRFAWVTASGASHWSAGRDRDARITARSA